MHRSFRGALFGALALLLVLGVGNVACNDGGSGPSTCVIDTSGGDGNSTNGLGGQSKGVFFWIDYGGAGSIEVTSSGSVDASFTPTESFTPELGANPLVVASDLSIPVVTSAPSLGTPYTLDGEPSLYVSDGDMDLGDETPVTGLHVQAGVTVTLGLNASDPDSSSQALSYPAFTPSLNTGRLDFSDDVVNDGTITVVDVDAQQRGHIILLVGGDYVGSGRIETFGSIPGQSGGDIWVVPGGSGYNSGDWGAYGADATDGPGGDGGSILFFTGVFEFPDVDPLEPGGLIENTGNMNANGGAGTRGGLAYVIYIQSYLSLWNSGDLDASGGDGVERGGGGCDVLALGALRGELRNTGDLTCDSGDAANGFANDAGTIYLDASGSDLRSSGVMSIRGGDSAGDERSGGGYGGSIYVRTHPSYDGWDASEPDVPAGDIWFSGGVIATGGDVSASDGRGGTGGYVSFEISNYLSEGTQAIHVLGIEGVRAQGGDAGLDGGRGGYLGFNLAFEEGTATGSVNVEPPMNTSGGDADPGLSRSEGGDAGNIEIIAGTISYGSVTAVGGTGDRPGADGTITPETPMP